MNPLVTVSGGGIIGNYISSRLNNNNIETLVIEKSPADLSDKENIRTLTLNSYSKELLDDLGINIDFAEIKKINVFDGEGTGKIDFSSDEINSENLSYVVYFNDLQSALKRKEQERTLFEEEIKRFKEDANEVKSGFECGISIEDFNDIKVGDVIESYEIQEIKRKL